MHHFGFVQRTLFCQRCPAEIVQLASQLALMGIFLEEQHDLIDLCLRVNESRREIDLHFHHLQLLLNTLLIAVSLPSVLLGAVQVFPESP